MLNQPLIDKEAINHNDFMGCELKIQSEQFPGILLTTKVVGIYEDNLLIDRSGSNGLVDDLINNQKILVHVVYKGEPVVFDSKIVSPMKGRMYIPLSQNLRPEINRAFERVALQTDVRLAYFNNASISTARLSHLKWIETKSINVSGGGVMVELPIDLTSDYYLIMHLGLNHHEIPQLLLGQVRHSNSVGNKYSVGVEFIIKETYKSFLPMSLIRNLPKKIFEFGEIGRKKLDGIIKQEKIGICNTGV